MGFVGDVIGGLTGSGAKAAKGAAAAQEDSINRAIEVQRETTEKQLKYLTESRDLARSDLQPFRDTGSSVLGGLKDLVTDPTKQAEFIQSNPFFKGLATKAKNDILGNQAAKGKVGSGGTAEALQNSYLLLGNDLLNQNIGQRMNLATLGSNAAAGQATASINTGSSASSAIGAGGTNTANLVTSQGEARAAGIMGARNAQAGAFNNALGTILAL